MVLLVDARALDLEEAKFVSAWKALSLTKKQNDLAKSLYRFQGRNASSITGMLSMGMGRAGIQIMDMADNLARRLSEFDYTGLDAEQSAAQATQEDMCWRNFHQLCENLNRMAKTAAEGDDLPADSAASVYLATLTTAPDGLPDPGLGTQWAVPVLRVLGDLRPEVRVAALGALEFRKDWRPGQAELILQVGSGAGFEMRHSKRVLANELRHLFHPHGAVMVMGRNLKWRRTQINRQILDRGNCCGPLPCSARSSTSSC